MTKVLFCDVDGVLLDYNSAYKELWNKVFPENKIELVNPDGYTYYDLYDCPRLYRDDVLKFEDAKDYEFWSTMKPYNSEAKEMLERYKSQGYYIVALTAARERTYEARLTNLEDYYGSLIDRVVCLGHGRKNLFTDYFWPRLPRDTKSHRVIIDDYYPYVSKVETAEVIVYDRAPKSELNPNARAYGKVKTVTSLTELGG